MAPAGISPMPQPLPQQQPSTINSIPSRPLPDDKPFRFIFLHHRENQTCPVTARHLGIGAGGSETPQDHLITLFQKKPSMGVSLQSPE